MKDLLLNRIINGRRSCIVLFIHLLVRKNHTVSKRSQHILFLSAAQQMSYHKGVCHLSFCSSSPGNFNIVLTYIQRRSNVVCQAI